MEQIRPLVGTGVYVVKDGKVLLGKRQGEAGTGMWCAPGGHLEMYETMEECTRRETTEEAGIEIKNIRFLTATEDFNKEVGKHYITLNFLADWKDGEPREEAGKIGEWGWYAPDNLPQPLFYPTRTFINSKYNPLNK